MILRNKHAIAFAVVACIFSLVFYLLTAPKSLPDDLDLNSLGSKIANGEKVFWASGCSSCHSEKGAKGRNKMLLGGGHRLETPFGVFLTPNISPDPETGIGKWSLQDFAKSMLLGQSPKGLHYYPAFPYTSYRNIKSQDLVDLFAFLKTLPPVSKVNEPHELPLPLRWRRLVGGWKWLFMEEQFPSNIEQVTRGQYLVQTLGHCGECHTPRNFLGAVEVARQFSGATAPNGEGKIPNITPHADGIGEWSVSDISYYLEVGFTPDFDSVGGDMVSVQENLSNLLPEDRTAIAEYLKILRPIANQ